jgi:hypothetical protein
VGAGPDFRARLAPYPCGVTSFQQDLTRTSRCHPGTAMPGRCSRIHHNRDWPSSNGKTPNPLTISESTLTPRTVRITSVVLRRLAALISGSALASRQVVARKAERPR